MAAIQFPCLRLRVVCLGILLCFGSVQGESAPVSAQHLTLELIAENASIAPAVSFRAGLKFNLEKGWHVYWINPGDSGQPPKVEWKLPEGFQAGEIEWPTPSRLPISKLMDYGYEDKVLLMMPIHPPASLKPGTTAQLAATVKWLVCREVCLPGHAEVALTLPVLSESPKPSRNQDLFSQTRASLPRPAPRNWKQSAVAQKDGFVLTLRTGKQVKSAVFFPLEEEQIENAAPQQVNFNATGVRIALKKSEQLLKPIARLRGVVVLDGKGYEINAPVVTRVAQPSSAVP